MSIFVSDTKCIINLLLPKRVYIPHLFNAFGHRPYIINVYHYMSYCKRMTMLRKNKYT